MSDAAESTGNGTASGSLMGARQPQIAGARLVQGQAVFAADVSLSGMLHASILRSPVPHARIGRIDADAARRAPGVEYVLTGAEAAQLSDPIPHYLDPAPIGGKHADVRCLAVDTVVYAGQPVAVVAASSPNEAKAAAELIEVDYQPLPHVLDAQAALAPDAPRLYDGWDDNVVLSFGQKAGDVEAAFEQAEHVISGSVSVQRSAASPLEPRAYVASWNAASGRLTLYAATQNPHTLREMLARSLRLRESDVRIITPSLGGAFGSKMPSHPEETLIPLLARLAGAPVRWVEDRRESLLVGGREQVHQFEVAADGDGRVRAIRNDIVGSTGAVASLPGWAMVLMAALAMPCGYNVQDCEITYTAVATNKAPWNAQRGFGKEAANLVMERIMDAVARQLELDPAEVRRRNLVGADAFPYTTATGFVLDSGDYDAVLSDALELFGYEDERRRQRAAREQGRHLGIGVAFEVMPEGGAIPGVGGGFDSATVRINPSGQVTVLTGVTSPGGGNDTALAQIVADELGAELGEIEVVQGDTDVCPFGFGNGTGRSVVTGGSAAALAARDLRERLVSVAAVMLEADVGDLVARGGKVVVAQEPERAVALGDVARSVVTLSHLTAMGVEPSLEASRVYRAPHVNHIPDEQGRMNPYPTYGNAAYAALVEVDIETGTVTPVRVAVCHDCGTVVNPLLVDGQIQGGIVMGLGVALGEEVAYGADGVPAVTTFAEYLMPRAADVPEILITHRETPSPYTLLGTKGAGEAGLAGAQAAIVSAVEDAIAPLGGRVTELPLRPPAVLDAMDRRAT
ncbi:MAG: xanthine dehydrogenase family protein molybdopterin-binding subunit [Actinomycetia bacterium]|nr:xanthine dehydrogenase family protein molybdopterin-binding subunit [Actinomycetes bacterium]